MFSLNRGPNTIFVLHRNITMNKLLSQASICIFIAVVFTSECPSTSLRILDLVGANSSHEDTISTSLMDANTDVAFLDGFGWNNNHMLIDRLPRQPDGSIKLRPGLWAYTAQSYCLHAGTHAPSRGDGYLYAPLQGQRAVVIRHLLQHSVDHPEINQRTIQMLIWSILARVKITDLPLVEQQAALRLLTPANILEVNGGIIGTLTPEAKEKILATLPASVRRIIEIEGQIRELFLKGKATYEQIERIAILTGVGPRGSGSRDVPDRRWSYHPDGYFVSYQPQNYSLTNVRIFVPEVIQVQRDASKQIVALIDPNGSQIQISNVGSAVRVRIAKPIIAQPERQYLRILEGELNPPSTSVIENAVADGKRIAPKMTKTELNDLRDITRLALGAEIGIEGGSNDIARRAWMLLVCHAAGGCMEGLAEVPLLKMTNGLNCSDNVDKADAGAVSFDPSGSVAVPGNTGAQRLAISNRPNNSNNSNNSNKDCDKVKEFMEKHNKLANAYGDQEDCKKFSSVEEFEIEVQRKVFGGQVMTYCADHGYDPCQGRARCVDSNCKIYEGKRWWQLQL